MISRSCRPSSSEATRAASRSAYADLHGEPPPVAVYAADAAGAVLDAAATAGASRAGRWRAALAALPAHDGLLGRWAATPGGGITPRRLAVLVVAAGAFRVERVVSRRRSVAVVR